MCGVAGIAAPTVVALTAIQRMNDSQQHRGPDGSGIAILSADGLHVAHGRGEGADLPAGRVALGHQRLSILDLSEAGAQPMASRDDRLVIVFNGEVYNYREIARELARKDTLRGGSDTEVVLAAFATWGPACFSRFNGMWAMAILDRASNRLTLSRDRFGVKPLHYSEDGARLLFASEIKAILAVRAQRPRLQRERALAYLRDGLLNDTNDTFFEGIHAFPPGHYAQLDLAQPARMTFTRFWAPPAGVELASSRLSRIEAEAEFRNLLVSSVNLRMRADVPGSARASPAASIPRRSSASPRRCGPLAT